MGTVESFIVFFGHQPRYPRAEEFVTVSAVAEDSPEFAGNDDGTDFIITLLLIHFIVDGVEKP